MSRIIRWVPRRALCQLGLAVTLRIAWPSNQGDKEMMTKTRPEDVPAGRRPLRTLTSAHLSHVVGGQAGGCPRPIPPDPC